MYSERIGWVLFLCLLGRLVNAAPQIRITSPPPGRIDTAYLRVEGTQQGVHTPMWYEVRLNGPTGRLVDFGAFPQSPRWFFVARHLATGANHIRVYGQDAAGLRAMASVVVRIAPDDTTRVRPRPRPAEVWWGGLGANEQLTDPARRWDFVKQHADGYLFHSAYWSMERIQTIAKGIREQLDPFGTRFMIELGGQQTVMYSEESARVQFKNWGVPGILSRYYDHAGICFSEITHDYGIDFEPAARHYLSTVNPWAREPEVLRYAVDHLWGNLYFRPNFAAAPWLKGAVTTSEAWRWFENYPSCWSDEVDFTKTSSADSTEGVYVPVRTTRTTLAPQSAGEPFLVNGKPVDLRFNLKDVLERFIQMFRRIPGHDHFAFYSDFPYIHMTLTGEQTPHAVRARLMLRAVERYLHSRGARHTFVCNDIPASRTEDPLQEHRRWAEHSLQSVILHQREGGRADRYLFESWYATTVVTPDGETNTEFPFWVAPEHQEWSYTNLTKRAVQYVKGIGNDGRPLPLKLDVKRLGAVAVVTLTNTSDVVCMPALAVREQAARGIRTTWRDAHARDISRVIRSEEGWVCVDLLQPNESVTVSCEWVVPYKKPVPDGPRVVVEAFWNPQDPTGVVRDRAIWTFGAKQ